MPDQQDVVGHLAADQFKEVPGTVGPDEQDLGRVILRIDLSLEQRHVDGVRDVLNAAAVLQR